MGGSSLLVAPIVATVNCISAHCSKSYGGGSGISNHPTVRFPVSSRPIRFASSAQKSHAHSNCSASDDEEEEGLVKDLRVPEQWLDPSKASEIIDSNSAATPLYIENLRLQNSSNVLKSERTTKRYNQEETSYGMYIKLGVIPPGTENESEWLRVNLHKWLDDEYCPEPTNVEISNIAAYSYYESLVQRQTDLGEILLNMARELESISYQESFHGAFSSANAAVDLIIQRLERD